MEAAATSGFRGSFKCSQVTLASGDRGYLGLAGIRLHTQRDEISTRPRFPVPPPLCPVLLPSQGRQSAPEARGYFAVPRVSRGITHRVRSFTEHDSGAHARRRVLQLCRPLLVLLPSAYTEPLRKPLNFSTATSSHVMC